MKLLIRWTWKKNATDLSMQYGYKTFFFQDCIFHMEIIDYWYFDKTHYDIPFGEKQAI